jgi:hypothetical protein
MRFLCASAVVVAALPLTSCGGGDGGGTPAPVTVSIVRTAGLGGSISADGVIRSTSLFVGDFVLTGLPEMGLRAFVSFDLSAIPLSATIQSATLRVTQTSTVVEPYAGLGSLVVDQVVYGAALDGGAYARSFPSSQGIVISADPVLGLKTASVTEAAQNGLSDTRVQFRIRFQTETDLDGGSEQIVLNDILPTGELPTLVVTYLP